MTIRRRQFFAAGVSITCLSNQATWAQSGKVGTRKIVLGQSVPLTGAADQIGLATQWGKVIF